MSIIYDEFISSLLFSPDYLPDVLQWVKKQPQDNGHISGASIEKILHVISYSCWKLFLQAMDGPCELTQEDMAAADYKLLTETGIAHIEAVRLLGEGEESYNLLLTDVTRQILRTLDLERVKQEKSRNCAVHLVAVAAVYAYGILEKSTFIDLFNRYMMEGNSSTPADSVQLLTPGELESILAPYTELCIDTLLLDNYLVNRMLYNGSPDDIPRFFSKVSADKYYPFEIEPLLVYTDSNYFEMTPQIKAFLDAMTESLPKMTTADLYLVSLIFVPCYLFDWSQIIEVQLCPMLKPLQREEQEKMAEAFVRAKRSARSWCFKGFSEDEVDSSGEGVERDMREFMRVLDEC